MLCELFADRRAAIKGEVDAQMTSGEGSEVAVPALGHSPAYAVTRTHMTQTGLASTSKRPAPRRGRRWSLALASALVVAAASGVFAMKARGHAPIQGIASGTPPFACLRNVDCAGSGAGLVCDAGSCVATRGCSSNAECTRQHDGKPFRCNKASGQCAPLVSEDCTLLASDKAVQDDATLWIGTMFPMTGSAAAEFGYDETHAADLVRRDFTDLAQGIPLRKSGAPPRPLGIVACDDSVDPTRAARHLVEDVGVPAVVGFHTSQEAIDLATNLFIPHGVLTIASPNRSGLIGEVQQPEGQPRLVWRTTVGAVQFAEPIAALVSGLIEPQLRATPGAVTEDAPLRIASLRMRSNAGLSLADALFRSLRFNGKSALQNGDDFRELVFSEGEGPERQADYANIVRSLLAFKPHIVLYAGGQGLPSGVFRAVEAEWPKGAKHRPFYLSNTVLRADELQTVGKSAERRRRFLGVNTPATTMANAQFTMRYNETFTAKLTTTTSPAETYDAMYLLAYAAYAAGDVPLTGARLAQAFSRLLPAGPSVDVGPTRIFEVFGVLRSGRNVDLNGAGTLLDFDVRTGEPGTDFVALCMTVDEKGNAVGAMESGVRYAAATKRLEGKLRCP